MTTRYVSIHTVTCTKNGIEIPFYIYYDAETKQVINTKCGLISAHEYRGMRCPLPACPLEATSQIPMEPIE